jgi:hypothetical protein
VIYEIEATGEGAVEARKGVFVGILVIFRCGGK